jgi:hypothetical protein
LYGPYRAGEEKSVESAFGLEGQEVAILPVGKERLLVLMKKRFESAFGLENFEEKKNKDLEIQKKKDRKPKE